MISYNADLLDGVVTPSEGGKLMVICGRGIAKVFDDKGVEMKDFKFPYDSRVKRIETIARKANIEVDLNSLLCYPSERERTIEINRVEGWLFEEYVYSILSSKFSVDRQREYFPSLSKFTGKRNYNRPDFIVNGVIPVEAKTGHVDREQILEYSTLFRKGVVAIAFRSSCHVPEGWFCIQDVLKDGQRMLSIVESLLPR